jgi:hypothetical protein
MWLGVPQALVDEFKDLAGVQLHRPKRANYRLPLINGVPLIPWRYAKDSKTKVDSVPFGHPVSDTRRSLFEEIELQAELPFGEAGLGDALIAELTPRQRLELGSYGQDIKALAGGQLVAVLAYASNPDALLRCYVGYAELGAHDLLQWRYREEFELSSIERPVLRGVAGPASSRPTFDAGPLETPTLRPRSPLEAKPTGNGESAPRSEKTGVDE